MTKDFGINAGLVSELFGMYLHDPASVDERWRTYLESLIAGSDLALAQRAGGEAAPALSESEARLQAGVGQLITAYRTRGHLLARIDPLGLTQHEAPPDATDFALRTFGLNEAALDKTFSTVDLPGPSTATLRDIIGRLQATYCRSIGVEFELIEEPEMRKWLQQRMESTGNRIDLDPELTRRILTRLTDAETLETFLDKSFKGAKRFSIEGAESMIPLLDLLIDTVADFEAEEIVLGMAHRGRLNVLVNLLDKNVREIFAAFIDSDPERHLGSGDVKYHLGASTDRITSSGKNVHLTLAFNPSHLEFVNPVVEGRVRAKQDRRGDVQRKKVVPLLIHGDAAFIGQGVNAETLNLARLDGYHTGGTIHIIVNNQIGFTTQPRDSRSTRYATDLARLLRVPVFHVNGEDLEAVAHVAKLAGEYRQRFGADVVVDMYCYRKFGHNETDDPHATQPTMYSVIDLKPPIRQVFVKRLVNENRITQAEADTIAAASHQALNEALEQTRRSEISWVPHAMGGVWKPFKGGRDSETSEVATKVEREKLIALAKKLYIAPEGFNANNVVGRVMATRLKKIEANEPFDWGTAEGLAMASLLVEGTPVRLSGQDSRRGTFSHRHSVLFDSKTGARYTPLENLSKNQGWFQVWDSALSEAGVLGFDYGFSLDYPDSLVMWEAQFGDFANGAQVIIDQFISSGEDKWKRLSGITLLLPHGYEGAGPEHSSARLGRFLSLCAEDNMQVCNLTTPAQIFHALRRQVVRPWRKPLIIMTPKSLLRLPEATSTLDDLSEGGFQRVIPDVSNANPADAKKILLCSGKIYYELAKARKVFGANDVAIVRLEQLYPLDESLTKALASFKDGTPLVWVQEETWNEGAWYTLNARLPLLLGTRLPLSCVARDESASPATGSTASHIFEQRRLIAQAIGVALDDPKLKEVIAGR